MITKEGGQFSIFFSPGFKASRKSGSTKTRIKTFSRSKVDPETVKNALFSLPQITFFSWNQCSGTTRYFGLSLYDNENYFYSLFTYE